MNAVVSALKLHLNQRRGTFLTPLWIAGLVAIVSVLIALIFWRSGSQPGSPGWILGSQSNPGIIYALGGFLVYFGVASVATTYPFALTLGCTRRAFVVGTLIWDAFVAAYVAVVFLVLDEIVWRNFLQLHTGILGLLIVILILFLPAGVLSFDWRALLKKKVSAT